MNLHNIKKLLQCFICYLIVLYFLFSQSSKVSAEGISLETKPSFYRIEAIPPSNPEAPISIKNQGNEPLGIEIILKPFTPSEEFSGKIEHLDDKDTPKRYKNIFKKIHLVDNGITTDHFDLGPQQKKDLTLHLDISKNEINKDYYFSIIFLAKPLNPEKPIIPFETETYTGKTKTEVTSQTNINAGISTNIILSIGKNQDIEASIEEFSTKKIIESGPVYFTVSLKNNSLHAIKPRGIIFIKNIFGQTIGRIDLESVNILSGFTHNLSNQKTDINYTPPKRNNETESLKKTIWNEKFLVGPYTATLNLALSENGPIYNKSIIFLALPTKLIIMLFIIALSTIYVFIRVKNRLKNNN